MTLTIDLSPEIEARVREEARREGIDAGAYVVRAVESRLAEPAMLASPVVESDLLRMIGIGLSEGAWARYHELIDRRQAGLLSPAELTELTQLSDRIEMANVRRMPYLIELAKLRNLPLVDLMDELGLSRRIPSDV